MMSTIILESSMIECNLTELLLDFTFIKNRLIVLSQVKDNDKIIIWDNKIYIDETPIVLQPFTRYITGQSRYNIQLFLHNQFKEYSAILSKNGADILVAGSAIFKSNDPIQTIAEMKKS